MTTDARILTPALPGPSGDLLAKLEGIYRDIHTNPELSMQEHRTAGIAAAWLREQGYDVTEHVGGTGVVGLLRNGVGPVVLLRADMDALPIKESTGLAYASSKTGTDRFGQATAIAHACGHDMHVAWLMGATRILAENRTLWRGTVMAVFQPGEETGQGARAMIEDGMVKRFPKPDVTLGQHVMPLSAGQIGWRIGTAIAAKSRERKPAGSDSGVGGTAGGDGGVGGDAFADRGVAGSGDDRLCGRHGRHYERRHE